MTAMEKEVCRIEELLKQAPKKPIETYNIRTKQEIEHEEYIHQEALKLGINLDMTNDVTEAEDFDKLQALVYLMQGKEVPEELRKKILEKKGSDMIEQEKNK